MTDNTKMREALIKFGDENPALDLDFRLHTHGKYLTQEKAIVASRAFKAGAAWQSAQSVPVVGEPDCYDAGLLNDFGGGNVEWWQDYIRYELERAHEFYVSQWPVVQAPVVSSVVGYLAGGTLMRRKIQGYECKPLVVKPAHSITAAELATLREKAKHVDCMRIALEHMMDMVGEPPEANCSCHLSPPCNDCVDHGGLRDAFSGAYAAIAQEGE